MYATGIEGSRAIAFTGARSGVNATKLEGVEYEDKLNCNGKRMSVSQQQLSVSRTDHSDSTRSTQNKVLSATYCRDASDGANRLTWKSSDGNDRARHKIATVDVEGAANDGTSYNMRLSISRVTFWR
jgi:hypothetical protein